MLLDFLGLGWGLCLGLQVLVIVLVLVLVLVLGMGLLLVPGGPRCLVLQMGLERGYEEGRERCSLFAHPLHHYSNTGHLVRIDVPAIINVQQMGRFFPWKRL